MKLLAFATFLMVVPSILCENVFLLNITPDEAQKYLASQSLDLRYASQIGENPLPATKSADGDFIYQGRKIKNPGDYVERHYLANQFHGQDGLGRALFGYTDWNQGRVEAINANGDVRGSYKYVDPHGKDFIANYWADSLGFHHEDNRPKVVLEPVTDTPAVQKARAEHFQKYKEAEENARLNPDPNSDLYNRNANKFDEDRAQMDHALEIIGGAVQHNRNYRASQNEDYYASQHDDGKYHPSDDEATGEPRGFFYSFDYPVQLLHRVHGDEEQHQEGYIAKRHTEDSVSLRALQEGAIPIDAVHDAQVHPNQKDSIQNDQIRPVLKHD